MYPLSSPDASVIPFWESINPIEAELYLRAVGPEISLLGGHISGPFCIGTRTLPANVRLQVNERDGERVLTAVLPDPCFWTPGRPYLYRAEVQLAHGEHKEEKNESLSLGIRPLTTRGPDLSYAGRRHVMRMIDLPQALEASDDQEGFLDACLETGTALLLREFREDICRRASEKGVFLVLQIQEESSQSIAGDLEQLARWPAVGMVVLPTNLPLDSMPASGSGSPLRAVVVAPHVPQPPTWAQVLIFDEEYLRKNPVAGSRIPRMVFCRIAAATPLPEARRICDDLQRRTADFPQMVGYIASSSGALY